MTDSYEPIRSYQRIFRPERRIYAVEGHALPVPGGVPLRWAAWAAAALVCVLALASGSLAVAVPLAAAAGLGAATLGGRAAAPLAAAAALAAVWLTGAALATLDWPLRLVVIPVAVATLATQATPDGRRAERFAASWLSLHLSPRRRSLGRPLPAAGARHLYEAELWVAPDGRSPALRRGRVAGPAIVSFAAPLAVRRAGPRQRRLLAAPPRCRARRGEIVAAKLALGEGEALEVRP